MCVFDGPLFLKTCLREILIAALAETGKIHIANSLEEVDIRVRMKLIVAGATGLVGSEIIKLSLEIPEITSVIALARKPVQVEGGRTPSKVKSVIIKDYGEYSDDAKAEFAGADACIW